VTRAIFSAVCFLMAVAALPVPVSAQTGSAPITSSPFMRSPTAAVAIPDEARIKVGVEILENLKIFDIILLVGSKQIMNDPDYPLADRPIIFGYIREEMTLVKAQWLRRVSIACIGPMTDVQAQTMLRLSQMKFIQDYLAYSADQTLPEPNFNALPPKDQAFINSDAASSAMSAFVDKFSVDVMLPELIQATIKAHQRYEAYKQPTPKP
jgi:hypothetical protein